MKKFTIKSVIAGMALLFSSQATAYKSDEPVERNPEPSAPTEKTISTNNSEILDKNLKDKGISPDLSRVQTMPAKPIVPTESIKMEKLPPVRSTTTPPSTPKNVTIANPKKEIAATKNDANDSDLFLGVNPETIGDDMGVTTPISSKEALAASPENKNNSATMNITYTYGSATDINKAKGTTIVVEGIKNAAIAGVLALGGVLGIGYFRNKRRERVAKNAEIQSSTAGTPDDKLNKVLDDDRSQNPQQKQSQEDIEEAIKAEKINRENSPPTQQSEKARFVPPVSEEIESYSKENFLKKMKQVQQAYKDGELKEILHFKSNDKGSEHTAYEDKQGNRYIFVRKEDGTGYSNKSSVDSPLNKWKTKILENGDMVKSNGDSTLIVSRTENGGMHFDTKNFDGAGLGHDVIVKTDNANVSFSFNDDGTVNEKSIKINGELEKNIITFASKDGELTINEQGKLVQRHDEVYSMVTTADSKKQPSPQPTIDKATEAVATTQRPNVTNAEQQNVTQTVENKPVKTDTLNDDKEKSQKPLTTKQIARNDRAEHYAETAKKTTDEAKGAVAEAKKTNTRTGVDKATELVQKASEAAGRARRSAKITDNPELIKQADGVTTDLANVRKELASTKKQVTKNSDSITKLAKKIAKAVVAIMPKGTDVSQVIDVEAGLKRGSEKVILNSGNEKLSVSVKAIAARADNNRQAAHR